jgi:uncharacterized protein YacL
MSVEFILRIIGMLVFAFLGGYWGGLAGRIAGQTTFYVVIFGLVGALVGLILTPYFTTRPVRTIRSSLGRLSAETLFAGLSGLVVGLLTAALLAFPLSLLPNPFGSVFPFVGVVLLTNMGV